MIERRYQKVVERNQTSWLPACVEDYVAEHNPVRAIEAWVNTLDLRELNFKHTKPRVGAGQPAYDPALLVKLYLFGYQRGIRSSRKLEYETRVNLEVIWLCQGAQPSYKTIADFRKDNGEALKAAQREFLSLCGKLSLFGGERVAIDGSFFKADANPSSMHTAAGLQKNLEQLEEKIARYHQQLDEADRQESEAGEAAMMEDPELAAKLERMKEREAKLKDLQKQLEASGEKQISTVDADARLLKKNGKTVGGYNVQVAVDDKHKLIVAQEVTQDGNDTQQLAPMVQSAKEELQCESLSAVADAGYYNSEQLKQCEEQSATVYVPIPKAPKGKKGRFGRDDFRYEADEDVYVCPQQQKLVRAGSYQNRGRHYHTYRSDAAICGQCEQSKQCLPKSGGCRRIQRWEHEEVVDRHRHRMSEHPGMMRERSALVEHPFGTLKRWAGMDHFLMRGLRKCRGEFSLMSLGYNFKRVLNIVGVEALMSNCA